MKNLYCRLDEVAKIISGSTPSTRRAEYYGGEILWATPKDLSSLEDIYIDNTEKKITASGLRSCSTTMLPAGAVLFSSRAPIGLIAIARHQICTNQGFKSFICDKDKLVPEYLYYCLRFYRPAIQNLGRGATFTEVSKELISRFRIPVPSISTQEKIAALLINSEQVIKKRRHTLRLADDLLKSAFLDMFGDPFNTHVHRVKLSEICSINPPKGEISDKPDELEVSFLPMVDVSEKGEVNLRQQKRVGDLKTGFTFFCDNDVLFAKITPCMENGKGAIVRGLRNGIGFGSTEFHVLRAGKESRPEWLYYLTSFRIFRKIAENNMTGTAGQKRVPASFLENVKVVVPSVLKQQRFADLVQRVERHKAVLRRSEAHLQTLFNALMQRAFKGELIS